jgi:hypothetical protein
MKIILKIEQDKENGKKIISIEGDLPSNTQINYDEYGDGLSIKIP